MSEVTHRCPVGIGGRLMPCCRRTPFEVPRGARLTTIPRLVTCGTPEARSETQEDA